jgi:hypothetical protein
MDQPLSPRVKQMIPRERLEAAGISDPDSLPTLNQIDLATAARIQVRNGRPRACMQAAAGGLQRRRRPQPAAAPLR